MQQQVFIQTNSSNNTGFSWSDFFSFRRMITLQVIQVIYFIVAGLITLAGVITLFSGDSFSGIMPGGFLAGLAILIFGNILWRIWCEIIIVFFRINNTLTDIDNHTKDEQL